MSADGVPHNPGAAERLLGLTLLDQWVVTERTRQDEGISGQSRSCCYKAQNKDGINAFVKAFDFRREELKLDTDHLERMVREYNHERDTHFFCRDQRMNRVTRIFGAGSTIVDGEAVHFIVCEWADKCLREHQPPGDNSVPLHLRLTSLRNAAAALAQMHSAGVAHQDIKPSNAVCYGNAGVKLTDLGSSSCRKMPAPPHDSENLVGQPNYAPYELLYNEVSPSWSIRRFGCDLFLLGNLCYTQLVGSSLTVAALHYIPSHLRYTNYTVRYEEALPHLIEAHEALIPPFLSAVLPSELVGDIVPLVLCLCHPDPSRRGHAKNLLSNGHQFGLERIISRFETLAKKAELLSRGRQ